MFSRVAGVVALASLVSCSGQIGRSTDSGPPAVDPILAVESGARRLSQAELDNTLRDLLGEDTAPAARLLNEDEFRPFDNDYTIQQASEALITSLEALAEQVAERAIGDAGRRAELVPCTPASGGDGQCFRAFLDSFLERALRREVTAQDVDAYMPLLECMLPARQGAAQSTPARYAILFAGQALGCDNYAKNESRIDGQSVTEGGHFIADTAYGQDFALTTPLLPLQGMENDFTMVSNLAIPFNAGSSDGSAVLRVQRNHFGSGNRRAERRPDDPQVFGRSLAAGLLRQRLRLLGPAVHFIWPRWRERRPHRGAGQPSGRLSFALHGLRPRWRPRRRTFRFRDARG